MTNERRLSARFARLGGRGLAASFVLACALALPLPLVGCSSTAADAQQSLEGTLEAVQHCESSTLDDLFSAVWFYPEDYGVSPECFAEAYFGNLTYAVDGAEAKDGSATVQLTVSAYKMADVLAAMEEARDEALAAGADPSVEGYADAVFAAKAEGASWGIDELAVPVALEQAEDGAWVVSDKATFAAVLLDGHDPRQAAQ